MKLKEYSTRQVMTILRANGFTLIRQRGGHGTFDRNGKTVTIPIHGKEVNRMLFARLIKENALDV